MWVVHSTDFTTNAKAAGFARPSGGCLGLTEEPEALCTEVPAIISAVERPGDPQLYLGSQHGQTGPNNYCLGHFHSVCSEALEAA